MFELPWLIITIVVVVGSLVLAGGLLLARQRRPGIQRLMTFVGFRLAGGPPWIVAEPNPDPLGEAVGSTTVSWSTGDGSPGEVWVRRGDAPEERFAAQPSGKQEAPWIQVGTDYHFRLYRGRDRRKLLAEATVRCVDSISSSPPATVAPPSSPPALVADDQRPIPPSATRLMPSPIMPFISIKENLPPSGERAGLYSIRWFSDSGTATRVHVVVENGAETPVAEGESGHLQVDWIQPDIRYEFRLLSGPGGQVLANTVLQRPRPWIKVEPVRTVSRRRRQRKTHQVAWSTGTGEPAQLYRADPDGRERLVAEGAEGDIVIHQNGATGPAELRLYAGRDGNRLLTRTPLIQQSRPVDRAFIEATPNPVPAGDGLGRTVLTWSTGDGTLGYVFLSVAQGEEISVAAGAVGTHEINWIASDIAYRFRLYRGEDRAKPLASVTVTRGNQRRELLLDLAVLGALIAPVVGIVAGTIWSAVVLSGKINRAWGRFRCD